MPNGTWLLERRQFFELATDSDRAARTVQAFNPFIEGVSKSHFADTPNGEMIFFLMLLNNIALFTDRNSI